MPHYAAQVGMAALMFSEPLSQRITWGLPRQEIICLSSLITRSAGKEKSASMPMAYLLLRQSHWRVLTFCRLPAGHALSPLTKLDWFLVAPIKSQAFRESNVCKVEFWGSAPTLCRLDKHACGSIGSLSGCANANSRAQSHNCCCCPLVWSATLQLLRSLHRAFARIDSKTSRS